MTEDEINALAEEIRKKKKKTISLAYDKSKKLRQSIDKLSIKVNEGCKKLIEETEPKLTEEGMKKIKFRSQFESTKTINALAQFIENQFSDFKVPNASQELTSIELNQFIRVVSRLMNETNRERSAADRIMGIDFALKKRSIYVPLSKVGSELGKLRDLQKEEYQIVKALEDLESLSIDVKNITQKISTTEEDQDKLHKESEDLKAEIETIERERDILLENPSIKDSRERIIRMTELEIEIGRHLNSFKKIFKKYAREIQRGSISGEFGLVNTALAYEKNPVQRFLKEEEGNPEIIALMEELLKVGQSGLHLKQKNINNLDKELKAIQQGKMDTWKKEWREHLSKNEEMEKSPELKSIHDKLKQQEAKITALKADLNDNEEKISLNEKKLSQFAESLSERHQRANDIATEALQTNN